jgi:hypothetical protein
MRLLGSQEDLDKAGRVGYRVTEWVFAGPVIVVLIVVTLFVRSTSLSRCRQVSAGRRACAFSAGPSGVVVPTGQGCRLGWLPRHCDWDSLPW